MRIIAAMLPTALLIEKIRKTVSMSAACPALRSPAAPDQATPSRRPTMATRNGASCFETASAMTRSSSAMDNSGK